MLGLILNGSAHFLSGRRAAGLGWFLGISACGAVGLAGLVIPGTGPFLLGSAFVGASFVLWVVMLSQSFRPVRRIGLSGWLGVIVLSVLLHNGGRCLARAFVHPFQIPSSTMAPSILPGDHLFVERLSYRFHKPERGDIVVFRTNGIGGLHSCPFQIKRIAGLPGERIRIDPPHLIADDRPVAKPKIFEVISGQSSGYAGFRLAAPGVSFPVLLSKPSDEIALGDGEYVVLGDNTCGSYDSRYWGSVPGSNIVGKVSRIYWPLNRINALRGE